MSEFTKSIDKNNNGREVKRKQISLQSENPFSNQRINRKYSYTEAAHNKKIMERSMN